MKLSTEQQIYFVAEIKKMETKGFLASRETLLPILYKGVYERLYNNSCGSCIREAYDNLIIWANKFNSNKITIMNTTNTRYKFKHEHRDAKPTFMHKGQRITVKSDNLTTERAQILLGMSKYAHLLEEIKGIDFPDVGEIEKKIEAPKAKPAIKETLTEKPIAALTPAKKIKIEPKVSTASVSTSKDHKQGGKGLNKNKGKRK